MFAAVLAASLLLWVVAALALWVALAQVTR